MSTTPADLAFVLAYAGARTAMELDINPEWVQLDVASRPGGSLRASVPGQYRPADQYLTGWARDFIAVLAPRPGAAAGAAQQAPAALTGARVRAAAARLAQVRGGYQVRSAEQIFSPNGPGSPPPPGQAIRPGRPVRASGSLSVAHWQG